jgi:hypothetical protein
MPPEAVVSARIQRTLSEMNQQAAAYAVMKWPSLAAHSRASLADALATVTPALTRPDARSRPDPRELRTVLPDNPLDTIAWQVPRSSAALDLVAVASPARVSALPYAVARTRPERTAFFGCLYYAALRPEEAVALRYANCQLPGSGWGMLRLAAAAPRTAAAWTSSGTSHEQRGLKHRPEGAIRMVPVPRCWPPCSVPTSRPGPGQPAGTALAAKTRRRSSPLAEPGSPGNSGERPRQPGQNTGIPRGRVIAIPFPPYCNAVDGNSAWVTAPSAESPAKADARRGRHWRQIVAKTRGHALVPHGGR